MFLQLVGEEANFFLFYELDTQFFMIGSSGFLSITVVLSRLYRTSSWRALVFLKSYAIS